MRRINAIFWATLAITFFFGLKPFNFNAVNDASLNPQSETLDLNLTDSTNRVSTQQGFAYASHPIQFPPNKALSLSIQLRPKRHHSKHGIICCLYDEKETERLFIAQWKNHLIIQSRRDTTTRGRDYEKIKVPNSLLTNQASNLLISSNSHGVEVFVNGTKVLKDRTFKLLTPSNFGPTTLLLGNNSTVNSPWVGQIKSFSLYHEFITPNSTSTPALRYTFSSGKIHNTGSESNPLLIPPTSFPLKIDWLSPFTIETLKRRNLQGDILLNIFGMIPLGLMTLYRFKTHLKSPFTKALLPILTCAIVSLIIESLQIILPSRDSSALDLVCNTFGGALAVLAYLIINRLFPTHPPQDTE